MPTMSGTATKWSFTTVVGYFTPTIDEQTGVLNLTSGARYETTFAQYTGGSFAGGATSFRLTFDFGYEGPQAPVYAGEWLLLHFGDVESITTDDVNAYNMYPWLTVQLWSFWTSELCLREYSNQFVCFGEVPELLKEERAVHRYVVEYHQSAGQLFVWIDPNTNPKPRAQLTLSQPTPIVSSSSTWIAFEGFGGGYDWASMQIHSFSFDSETFVPTPLPIDAAYDRRFALSVPESSYTATSFLLPVSVTSVLRVEFSMTIVHYIVTDKYGIMFVIQNLGVNVGGQFSWMFGFSTNQGFGLAISLLPSGGGNVYLYDGSLTNLDFHAEPQYPSQYCSAITADALLNVSMTIDLYGGSAKVTVKDTTTTNQCSVSFNNINRCTAMKAINLDARSAWVGFTSSWWYDGCNQFIINYFHIESDAAVATPPLFCSASVTPTPTLSITSSITITPTLSTLPEESKSPTTTNIITTTTTTTPIVVNKVCQDSSDTLCPSGKCVSDPSECTGAIGSGTDLSSSDVQTSVTTVSPSSEGKPVVINVVSGDKSVVASLRFPPNILRPGWTVQIEPPVEVYNSSSSLETEDNCGGTSELRSPAFQVTVKDKKDREVTQFAKPFTMSSFASFSSSEDNSVCFGYIDDRTSDKWKCVSKEHLKTIKTRQRGIHYVETQVDHLTTFAVLLNGRDLSDGCNDFGWIDIVSLSMLGAALVFVTVIVLLFYLNMPFRAFVSGYKPNMKISALVEKAEHERTQRS
eukprot:TRINITY_DN4466_c0_g1_i1.p1 TRINITY_DN4466_c0_g1~~TRINITY_DN4466_c0_g1_i1.p1  ORF type:complete len:796 (+),score=139.52 TRINITY_DN4466_c0_g1_i1:150-2390(+)